VVRKNFYKGRFLNRDRISISLLLLCAGLAGAATLSPKQTQLKLESGAVLNTTNTVSSLTVTTTYSDAFTFFIRSSNNWVQVSSDCKMWQNFCQLTTRVGLAWNASQQQITGYNLYVGTNSGVYSLACSSTTNSATVFGLIQGSTYYFAATCLAGDGSESAYSSEVAYTVPFNPPKFNRP
jgi:hypothetical protein